MDESTKYLKYARLVGNLKLFIKRFGVWGLAPFKKGLLVAILLEKKLIPMNQNGFYLLRRKFEIEDKLLVKKIVQMKRIYHLKI
jgi:hypothetical protein